MGLSVNNFNLWVLTHLDPGSPRGNNLYRAVARLSRGVELPAAEAEVAAIARHLEESFPDTNRGVMLRLEPLHDAVVRDVDVALWGLQGVVIFVLLIVCANLGGILTARSSARTQEIAIRVALGAGRVRIFNQLLVENLGLVVTGAVLGFGLAYVGVDLLTGLGPAEMPRGSEIKIDGLVLAYTAVSALLIGLLASLIPALLAGRSNLSNLAKEGTRASTGLSRGRLLRGLAVLEVALSLVLLVGAGLSAKSLNRLSQVDTGFETEGRHAFEVALAGERYQESSRVHSFFNSLQGELASLPGVESVGLVRFLPLGSSWGTMAIELEGVDATDTADSGTIVNTVGGDYFQTLGIGLIRGRWLEPVDGSDSVPKVVVSESVAQLFSEDGLVLGRRLRLRGQEEEWMEIVGVVADISLRGLPVPPDPTVYLAQAQFPNRRMTLVVKTRGPTGSQDALFRAAAARVDATVPLANVLTLESLRSEALSGSRIIALLTGLFAIAATALALLGLYAMMSFLSVRRAHEIGIRMAVEANQRAVFRLILGAGLWMTVW